MLEKQRDLMKIEIKEFQLEEKYYKQKAYNKKYFMGLIKACKGLDYAIQALEKNEKEIREFIH
jgi:hypothetical protein